jgi:hypothetical protein
MVLKFLTTFLFLVTLAHTAKASQSFLDLGFIVPPGYFVLGVEHQQSSQKLSPSTNVVLEANSSVTYGYLQFGLLNHVDIKVSAGQGKADQTLKSTSILTGETTVVDSAEARGSVDPTVSMGIRWLGSGEENSFNVITHLGYSPRSGDKTFATDDEDANMLSGRSRYMGRLDLNLKFTQGDWLLSGEYIMNNKGNATNSDGTEPVELGAYSTTTFELRYRENYWRALYLDLFGGVSQVSESQDTDLDTSVTTTTAAYSQPFMGVGLGFLIAERFKIEGQLRAGSIGQKIKTTTSTGTSTEWENQKNQSVYIGASFIF